ncbi:ImmA/IrrE family metallo-endopeptidase [Azospirillum argentinense]
MSVTLEFETTFDIIKRFSRQPPTDVESLADALSIPIIFDGRLPDTVSGKLMRTTQHGGESGFAIVVNAKHGPRRQRFTMAHEIAHYALHRDLIKDEIVDNEMYRAKGISDEYEAQANSMAANILMPAELVRARYRQGDRSYSALARTFNVSEEAVKIRLKQLRIAA